MIFDEAVKIVENAGYDILRRGTDMIIINLQKLLDAGNGYFIAMKESYDELHTIITDLKETEDLLDYDEEYYQEVCARHGCKYEKWEITKEFTKLEDLEDFIKTLDDLSIWGKMSMTYNAAVQKLSCIYEMEEVSNKCQKIVKNKSKSENLPYEFWLKEENNRLYLTDFGKNLSGLKLDENKIKEFAEKYVDLEIKNNVIEKDFCELIDVTQLTKIIDYFRKNSEKL